MLNSPSDVETYEDSFKSSIFIYATAETMMVLYVHSWYTAIRNEFNEWLYYFILMTRYIYTKCWLAYECSEHMFPVFISANKTGHTWTTITFLNYPWNCWTVSLFLLQRMSICSLHLWMAILVIWTTLALLNSRSCTTSWLMWSFSDSFSGFLIFTHYSNKLVRLFRQMHLRCRRLVTS